MNKDYFTLEERKKYYLNMKLSHKSSLAEKEKASKRLTALMSVTPKTFVGTVRKKQNLLITVQGALNELIQGKHRWDQYAKPNIVKAHHKEYDSEIISLKSFRHKNKLSLQDKIIY